jgi:hypothetical protein
VSYFAEPTATWVSISSTSTDRSGDKRQQRRNDMYAKLVSISSTSTDRSGELENSRNGNHHKVSISSTSTDRSGETNDHVLRIGFLRLFPLVRLLRIEAGLWVAEDNYGAKLLEFPLVRLLRIEAGTFAIDEIVHVGIELSSGFH